MRKAEILSLARRHGAVLVDDLVAHFGVTAQTIRRDLAELADSGRLERTHGGAVLPPATTNLGYGERAELNSVAKADIAQACASQIPNDCAIFLNIGTTTEAVAAALTDHRGLLVVTNNINVAMILGASEDIDVVVTGGRVRRSDGGLIGDLAKDTIRQFRFDLAVIGCSALLPDGSILDYDMEEVGVSKAIMAHSAKVFLVADSSKFTRSAPAKIGDMGEIDTLFTDQAPPPEFSLKCADAGGRVSLASETTKAPAEQRRASLTHA